MAEYATLSVRWIAITASEEDVQRFFESKIPSGDPVVKSFVNDANRVFKSATVTFKGKTKAACKATVERLKDPSHQTLVDGTGTTSILDFDGDFLGLTELANRCANDENPYFDVYFVHGLGGHAYNSFRHKARDHRRSNMWARDTLPTSLDRPGKRGRYLTFGYPAPVLDSDEISQSVQETALQLLRKIRKDRGKHCERPLFFVCHSLGGLVVCQAALLALKSNEKDAYLRDYQKTFFTQGQTLIKGIIFFGTPFKGSRSANLGVKLATNLKIPLNKTHIMYLRVEDQDVAKFVDEFVERTEQIDLPLLIFFELKKTRVFFFRERVVERDSAKGRFGERVPKIGLLADHHKLVKFAHPERLYDQDVEGPIKELVHNALDAHEQGKRFAALRGSGVGLPSLLASRDARRISMQAIPTLMATEAPAVSHTPGGSLPKQSDNPAGPSFPDIARPELDGPSRTAANAWVEDTMRTLKFNQDERRIKDVDKGSVETCDWILAKTEFQRWNTSLIDSVMFVQGGPGLGKSVLAKFLVQYLERGDGNDAGEPSPYVAEQSRKPIVAHYFSRGTEFNDVDNSPKAILSRVLYQIWEADPVSCNKAILNLFNRFNQSRNLDFYWTLFNDVRTTLTRDLYCIIDGLDECIKEFKFPRQSIVDERMEGFLGRLCDIAGGPSTQEKSSSTKILVTTRPTVEVENATIGREVVLRIQESDTKAAVGKFVEEGVRLLAQRRHLSLPAQDFIKDEITQRSGHVFQTTQTALRRLRNERYNLEDPEVVSRALSRVNSKNLDDAYEETLEILESTPPKDRVKAARIIRILFFLQGSMTLLELENALLVDLQHSELILRPKPVQGTLDVFIRDNLGLLVNIDKESMVSLEHQTVREYFQSLSIDRWQAYSCAERKGGHLHLALICIRYLLLWPHQVVTGEEIDAHEGDELAVRFDKALFLRYASCYWDLHTREAGDFIIPHIPLVNKLLGLDNPQAYNEYCLPMLLMRWMYGLDILRKDRDFFPLLPISFLASNDLINVLRTHTFQRKMQQRRLAQTLMFWRSRAANDNTIEADIDLDMQDEKGLRLTPLHCACQNGHLEIAKLLIDCGASGKVFDTDRHTPFSLAVENDWEEIAEMLIMKSQYWDDAERGGRSLTLHLACLHGMSKVVRHLLRKRYDVNAQVLDGWTPVHVAAESGQLEILEVLLEAGGSPELATEAGNTPIHFAAQQGHLAVIEMLFRYESDMEPNPVRRNGVSALHAAAAGGHLEIYEYIEAKYQAKRQGVLPDEDGWLPIHFAAIGGHLAIINRLADRSDITEIEKNKKMPIHFAAANGHLEIVRRLLQLGRRVGISVDVKCRDLSATPEESPDGLLTPLYLAVAAGHLKTAGYLINEGADVNVLSYRKRTLLHEAARQDNSETFELLLNHDLDPFAKTVNDETPLHFAAARGSSDIVEIYLKMQDIDACLDMVDSDGDSALALAIRNKHAQIAGKLVSEGADVHLLDFIHDSCLMLSVDLEEMTLFKRLLEKGVDVNIANFYGQTALHRAAERGKVDACEMLIERDSRVNAETQVSKWTSLHFAVHRSNVDVVLRLLKAGADPFQRDGFGTCIMDYVTTYQPMLGVLRKYEQDYQPQSSEEQTRIRTQMFCDRLREMPSTSPNDRAGEVKLNISLLGLFSAALHLKDYEIYRICCEYRIARSPDSTPIPPYECNNCWRRYVDGSFWTCKECPQTDNCNECYEKRSEGQYTRGCSADHEYIELGGEEWRKLEKGKVNAKGQDFWEWIKELKETRLTVDDVETGIPTQQREKVTAVHEDGVV